MNFEEAFNLCDYDKKIKNDFLLFFKNNFDFNNPKINLFLFPQKDYVNIFLLQTIIKSNFNKNDYEINILIYFPQNFPKQKPKIFLEKIGNVKINPLCEFYININNLEINYDLIINWNENINFLVNILNEIQHQFSFAFPIFNLNNNNEESNKIIENECVLNKNICINIDVNNCNKKNVNLIEKINEDVNAISNEDNMRNAISYDIKNINQFIDINKINFNDNNDNNNKNNNNTNNQNNNQNNNNNNKNNNNKNINNKNKNNNNNNNINNANNNNNKNNNYNNNNYNYNNYNYNYNYKNNINNNNKKYNNYNYNKNIIPQYNENQIKFQIKKLIFSKVFPIINNNKKQNFIIKNNLEKIKYKLLSDKNSFENLQKKEFFINNTVNKLKLEILNTNFIPTQKITTDFNNLESFLIINNKQNLIKKAKINSSKELIIIIKKSFENKIIDFQTAFQLIRKQSRINFFLNYGKILINKNKQ